MPLIAWALKTDGNGDDHVVGLVAVDNCVDEAEIFENFFCYMRECDITPEHIATWAAEHDAFITAKYSK